jgi:hypothetical protein
MRSKAVAILTLTAILVFVPFFVLGSDNYLSHSISAVILVTDPEDAANALTMWVEEEGGYYLHRSKERVTLRIPYQKLGNLRSYTESIAEEVVRIELEAHDLREDILRLRSGLEAREEILMKNLGYIDKTDVKGTLAIEAEIRMLVEEIENHKGRLRKLETDRLFALGEIKLSFKEQTIPKDIPSSFGWINTIDFYRFIKGVSAREAFSVKPKAELPEGFAAVQSRWSYQAVSPEGMQYKVRMVKNYPEQELEFWGATLKNHLEKEGYHLMGESAGFQANDSAGIFYEWLMPYGNTDYIYLIAIMISKNCIVIAESAAEHMIYKKYREPVLDSLETINVRRR